MLLIGDQVYADDTDPATRKFIEQRRDPSSPPGYQVADFTEYCHLYREAWSEPSVRWLLSVIPTAMIFDDHDVHDDWNISAAWRRDYDAKPWWKARITGAYMSYWIYQHLGNLSPEDLAKDELWRQVQQPGDAAAVLADFASRADRRAGGIQWSYRRSIGGVRVVVIDSRSRVFPGGQRLMVGEAEWQWITESVAGDWDHVVLASSLPPTSAREDRGSAPAVVRVDRQTRRDSQNSSKPPSSDSPLTPSHPRPEQPQPRHSYPAERPSPPKKKRLPHTLITSTSSRSLHPPREVLL